ncbi:MAG: RpiB/LacA/LacB family sugar-phosphate isomerase [Parcubacteria group bacterium]|nr:RpiB/LacA/LacB family sugar-phosphate isomerase [Parcubacteria group bacterium]
MIYLGADHNGFEVKERLKKFLVDKGFLVEDVGAYSLNKNDDYVDFALKAGNAVVRNRGKGILLCGSGEGIVVAADKIDGIAAVLPHNAVSAIQSRRHNNANVLGLSAWDYSFGDIKHIVYEWLMTPFRREDRHVRRLNKIIGGVVAQPFQKLIPALLARDTAELKKKYTRVKNDFSLFQIDVMDGKFVETRNNITPSLLRAFSNEMVAEPRFVANVRERERDEERRRSGINEKDTARRSDEVGAALANMEQKSGFGKHLNMPSFEVHLMVDLKKDFRVILKKWCEQKSVARIIFHREAIQTKDIVPALHLIRSYGKEVGIALNPETDPRTVKSYLRYLESVLLLAVTPGRSGQAFQNAVLKKIKVLRSFENDIRIYLDGGVKIDTLSAILKSGVDGVVVGSGIFDGDSKENIRRFKYMVSKI